MFKPHSPNLKLHNGLPTIYGQRHVNLHIENQRKTMSIDVVLFYVLSYMYSRRQCPSSVADAVFRHSPLPLPPPLLSKYMSNRKKGVPMLPGKRYSLYNVQCSRVPVHRPLINIVKYYLCSTIWEGHNLNCQTRFFAKNSRDKICIVVFVVDVILFL